MFDYNKIDVAAMYVVPGDFLVDIRNLMTRLYSERKMGGDEMRDFGNLLNVHLTQHVDKYEEKK